MLGLKAPTCAAVKLLIGKEPKYALGETKCNDDKVVFEKNHFTGSEIRYQRMIEAFDEVSQAKLDGTTYQWVHRLYIQFEYIFSSIEKIKTQFILLFAQNDKIVDVHTHQQFVEKVQELEKDCKAYTIDNTQQELLKKRCAKD